MPRSHSHQREVQKRRSAARRRQRQPRDQTAQWWVDKAGRTYASRDPHQLPAPKDGKR